jgi:hypothetical protein
MQQEWARLTKLGESLPPLYIVNVHGYRWSWSKLPDRLAAACTGSGATLLTLRTLAARTSLQVQQGQRPDVLRWLELLVSGWSSVPQRLPVGMLQRFLDQPDTEPNLQCATCGARWPAQPESRLPECPGCLSSTMVWDDLSALTR